LTSSERERVDRNGERQKSSMAPLMKPKMRRPQKYGRNLRKLKREALNPVGGSIGGNFLGLLEAKQEARTQFFLQSSPQF